MWLENITIENIKSFEKASLTFDKRINILTGVNNSGKSTIINAIKSLQINHGVNEQSIRIGNDFGITSMTISDLDKRCKNYINPESKKLLTVFRYGPNHQTTRRAFINNRETDFRPFVQNEPDNFIYSFLSNRVSQQFNNTISHESIHNTDNSFNNLYGKIYRITTPEYPERENFINTTKSMINFIVSSYASKVHNHGFEAGIIVDKYNSIPLSLMGTGITNALTIVNDLCMADNNLFLIEELENDLHPKLLKKLLELIIEKADKNQFIISTHSNIVTKYLASHEYSKLFHFKLDYKNKLPITIVEEINTFEKRLEALKDLGYEIEDYELWKGYLILEESSAESIIKHLISWFSPELITKIRTISARGLNRIEAKFDDFNRLFVYLNLSPIYKNKAWVICDNNGKNIIDTLRSKYKNNWNEENFMTFTKDNFEEFYPEPYKSRFLQIKQESENRRELFEKKKILTTEVLSWIISNEETAKIKFKESAVEIIELLDKIKRSLG